MFMLLFIATMISSSTRRELFLKSSSHEPKIIDERIKHFALLNKPTLKSKSAFYPHMMEDN
ncbi:hypothetical protein NC652_038421 [Populus alba x Populus x berolinensis]|nr:hypothetical protein NC652_038421 [Populus alba x Populus x berolinensis]